MDTATFIEFTQRGLMLAMWLSLPVALAAVVVGLLFAVLQATTQLQDQTTSTIVKLVAAALVLLVSARWIGHSVTTFVDEMWGRAGLHSTAPRS